MSADPPLAEYLRPRGSFSGHAYESDVAEEIEAHVQLMTEENMRPV
jgi:hypothetical protein